MREEKKLTQKEAIKKERQLVEEIVTVLKKLYGHYWNFEIDFVKGDVKKNFTLEIKIYKR